MDYNNPLDLLHMAEESDWVDKVNMARVDKRICTWVKSFHPKNLSCRADGGFLNGAYNLGQRFAFDDGTIWFLRLPRASSISPEYADEKVAMEVEALHLIRENTSIPVPEIHAWGFSEENPLGLGPFMLMSFIDGVCLKDVLGEDGSRLLKEGIPDPDIEYVYRQMARFMLQLFKIDFKRIGSLPTPRTKFPAPARPLTWKVHAVLRGGGVNTFGSCYAPK
jgi:aminoglycoside phosphotransferase (APT) family kinase protein